MSEPLMHLESRPRLRGKDLKLSESDVLRGLAPLARLKARIFGGAFGVAEPGAKDNFYIAVVYLPPMWKRLYIKIKTKLFGTKVVIGADTHATEG